MNANAISAMAQTGFSIIPPSGTKFTLDLNEPGPTMTCIGYADLGGTVYHKPTQWYVTEQGKDRTRISTSTPTFMLSNDVIQGNNLTATSSLTVLNVTSNLDGAIVECNFPGHGCFIALKR